MDEKRTAGEIRAAEVVLPCTELDETLAFFTERLGFRVASIFPADAPSVAVIVGHGLRVRLVRGAAGSPGVPSDPPLGLPALRPSFVLTRASGGPPWVTGRAGMRYRDLIPDRQGGRFIASQILIPEGGPVPDYVHYHRVRFQMIYCLEGSVRVVYEDQGPPFVLQAGDAVLQPPEIRHRVLECSPGLQVLEVSCPAEHETIADFELALPTASVRADRDFGGQRFVRHEAATARFAPWGTAGFESRDLGIAAATAGLAGAHVVRRSAASSGQEASSLTLLAHDRELQLSFVLAGSAVLHAEGRDPAPVSRGDAFVIPAGLAHGLASGTPDLAFLEVALPAR